MAKKDKASFAHRYGFSFFESLNESEKKIDIKAIQKTFEEFLQMCKGELGSFLSSPAFEVEEKFEVLKELKNKMQYQEEFHRFLEVLVQQGHFSYFSKAAAAFDQAVLQQNEKVHVNVSTAFALNEMQVNRVTYALSQKIGKDVLMDVRVDPELIGGIRAEVGGIIYDASITGQLNSLQKEIK